MAVATVPLPRGTVCGRPTLTLTRWGGMDTLSLHLSVVVIHVAGAADQDVVAHVARPDADLVAVGVDGDRRLILGREHHDTDRLVAAVEHLVRARGPRREADDVAALEGLLALGVAQDDRPVEDDQPLLAAVLVVVRADALAGRQLVDRRAHLRGADPRSEAVGPGAVALRVLGVVLRLRRVEVEALHHAARGSGDSTSQTPERPDGAATTGTRVSGRKPARSAARASTRAAERSSSRVCEAMTARRRRELPSGTVGGRIAWANTPASSAASVIRVASSAEPTISGMICVEEPATSKPSRASSSRSASALSCRRSTRRGCSSSSSSAP